MHRKALLDLAALIIIFIGSWFFKSFLPTEFQEAFVVIITSIVALLIIRIRHLSFKDIGFIKRDFTKGFFREVIYVSVLIFTIQFIGILITTPIFGSPETGNAVTNQPKSIIGFLLDNLIMVGLLLLLVKSLSLDG